MKLFPFLFWSLLSFSAVDPLLIDAEKLQRVGKQEDSQRLISQYITKNEGVTRYINVGSLFARLKKWSEAVHYYEIATNLDEKNALAWYELGIAQHQNKKTDAAVTSLRRAVAANPQAPQAVFALGEVLELTHARYDARNVYLAGIKKVGDRPEFESKLCWLFFSDSFYVEAIKRCERAVELNSKDVASWAVLGRAFYDSKRRDKAMNVWKGTLSKFPQAAIVYRARGLIYYSEKSYEQAMNDLAKAFSIDRDDDEAAVHLARSLYELGYYEHAMYIYIEASRLNPEYRFEFSSKQRDLEKKGKNDLAEKYQQAFEHIY